MKIHPKVTAATIGAAAGSIIVWSVNTFVRIHWHQPDTAPDFVPAQIASAFSIVCTFAFGWCCPSD